MCEQTIYQRLGLPEHPTAEEIIEFVNGTEPCLAPDDELCPDHQTCSRCETELWIAYAEQRERAIWEAMRELCSSFNEWCDTDDIECQFDTCPVAEKARAK